MNILFSEKVSDFLLERLKECNFDWTKRSTSYYECRAMSVVSEYSPKRSILNQIRNKVRTKKYRKFENIVVAVHNVNDDDHYLVFDLFVGTEQEILHKFQQIHDQVNIEHQIGTFFEESDRKKVHEFMERISIRAFYGGNKVVENCKIYAEGYMKAWSGQGPKPYVLCPKYGTNIVRVAYFICHPPDKLTKMLDEEFPHIVVRQVFNS